MSPSRLDTRFRLCSDFLHLPLFFPLIVLRKELVLMKQHLAEKASSLSPSSSTTPPPPYWTSLVESAGCTLSSCSSSSMKLVVGETTVLSCCWQSLPPPPSKSQLMKQVVLTVLRKCKTWVTGPSEPRNVDFGNRRRFQPLGKHFIRNLSTLRASICKGTAATIWNMTDPSALTIKALCHTTPVLNKLVRPKKVFS